MSIFFGKDTSKSLILVVYLDRNKYDNDNLHEFVNDFKNNERIPSNFIEHHFLNSEYHHNRLEISKDSDNYNFEEIVTKFKERKTAIYSDTTYNISVNDPVFIIKDQKWYYCSPETDMMLKYLGNFD